MTDNHISEFTPPTIRDLLTILFERKVGMTVLFVSTLVLACLVVFWLFSPKYESKAILLVSETDVIQPVINGPPKSDFEKLTDFHTQKDVIKSNRLAAEVATTLNLSEVRVIGNIERIRMLLKKLQNVIGELLGIERWTKPWDPEAETILAIDKNLKVSTSPESKAITLTYRAYSPQEAQDTLTTLIDSYQTYYYSQIKMEADGIINYLDSRVQDSRKQLLDREAAILNFKRQNLPDFNANDSLRYSAAGIADSAAVQDEFKLYILQLEEELRLLMQSVPEQDPRVIALKDKLSHFIAAANQLPALEMEMQRLDRIKELAQDKYILLARNLEQARLITLGQINNLGLISLLEKPSFKDTPVSPKKRLILILSVFMAAALALTWAYLMHFLDNRIRRPEDITDFPSLNYLGSMLELRGRS